MAKIDLKEGDRVKVYLAPAPANKITVKTHIVHGIPGNGVNDLTYWHFESEDTGENWYTTENLLLVLVESV